MKTIFTNRRAPNKRIKRSSFIKGVLFSLILIFAFHWFFDKEEYIFRLAFNGFDSPIEQVVIRFDSSELTIKNPHFESLGTNDKIIKFATPLEYGQFDLTVITTNGVTYNLIEIDYLSDNYNYIYLHGDMISFTTGHW